jgi:hypothetical protein
MTTPLYRRQACLFVAILAALTLASAGAFAQSRLRTRTSVVPSQIAHHGNSYADWAAAWWQWAFSLPADGHPLFDETGAQCAAGQSGPVWFLGGVFNVTGSAVRDECRVPSGKSLFFPIVNVECSNVEGNGDTSTALRACADFFASLATDLAVEVDGVPILGVDHFRIVSPSFGFELPENNLLQLFGAPASAGSCFTNDAGRCEPYLSAGDGFYLMLRPLSDGRHTIHFRGTFGDPINFTTDVTYHLTVGG